MALKLRIKNRSIEYGTLLYDGSTYVNAGDPDPSINGTMDLEFKLWLDKDFGYHNQMLGIRSDPNTHFMMILQDSSIYLSQYGLYKHISIVGFDNRVLNCRFRKFENTGATPEFYINNVQQTIQSTGTISCSGSYVGLLWGGGCFRTDPSFGSDYPRLDDAAIWDVKITEVSTGNLIHYWKGYPSGNLDSSWEDLAGNLDGNIVNIGGYDPSLINIEGTGGPVLSNSKNLRLSKKLTLNGLLDFDGSVGVTIEPGAGANPDVRGNRTLTWNMWLDSPVSTPVDNTPLICLSDESTNQVYWDGFFIQWFNPSTFYVTCSSTTFFDPIKNLVLEVPENIYNKKLQCEVKKQAYAPYYFKINDVSLNLISNNISSEVPARIIFGGGSNDDQSAFDTGTIWDIKVVDDDTSTLVHYWKGYPVGNQNSGWEDQVGDQDPSIVVKTGGIPTLRSVTYIDQGAGSKLRLGGTSFYTQIGLGLLYNWYAATDSSLIYADGWKVPSSTEFNTLRQYSDPDYISTIFKETGTTYWQSPNTWATNTAKFNARGSGWRNQIDGEFQDIYQKNQFLTSAQSGDNTTVYSMVYDTSLFSFGAFSKKAAGSIRLLKISTSLSNGQEGIYTGNDGKIYRTICIGTQEWLASNLAETKYRDGTPIPEITNNTTWKDSSTGALCAYNNDWNNV